MKLVLATNHFGLGGSESYLLTVAEQLDRLGHEAVIFTPEPSGGVEVAQALGIEVVDESGLSGDFDAALVQDGSVSYQLAALCPATPQLFVAHSNKYDLQAPPQLGDTVGTIVALNDRVAGRMRSFATEREVIRLRQPIDQGRFNPRGPLPEVPRRALLLSNNRNDDRLAMLEESCAEAGLELSQIGGLPGQATDVRSALAGVEIVIGYGRSVLEGMACGRAAYVYDWKGGDGWVTAESYAAIEADGFAGGAGDVVIDRAGLARDLRAYSAAMGPINHDLVIEHHRASSHTQELVALMRRLAGPQERPRAPLQEMARLVRLEWRARIDIQALAHENTYLRGLLDATEKERAKAMDTATRAQNRSERTAAEYEATLSWRLTAPLRRLGSALRRGFGDRRSGLSRAGRSHRPPAGDRGSGPTENGRGSLPPSPDGGGEKAPPVQAP
jgi:hypothetical protein